MLPWKNLFREIIVTIEKISNTTVRLGIDLEIYGFGFVMIAKQNLYTSVLTVTTLASNSLTATLKGQSVSHAAGMTCQTWDVEHYKA